MEPIFICEYTATFKMLQEIFRKHSLRRYIVILVIGYAVVLAQLIKPLFYGVLDVVLLKIWPMLLFLALMFFYPEFYLAVGMHNAKKQNNGVMPQRVVTAADTIVLREGMVQVTVEYSKINKVKHLKNSYILIFGKRNALTIDPNSFTKGTFEEFKQFLREKRPDLVIPE